MSAETITEAQTYREDMGRWHKYRLDGEIVPGVTTLINGGWPKNLAKWSADQVAEFAIDNWPRLAKMPPSQRLRELSGAPWANRDRAAMRGSQVHAIAEKLMRGEAVTVPADVAGYVQGCKRFLQEWDVRPLWAERPVFSREHKYGGTFDLIAEMGDGVTRLLDFKTVKEGKSAGWPDHALQGAAYIWAEFLLDESGEEVLMPGVNGFAVVELSPGGYQVIPMRSDKKVFHSFLSVMETAQAVKEGPDWVYAALKPPVRLEAA